MPITSKFDPARDGWYFSNWGEASEFSWELFRKTYLGINPTKDCVEAPLDCAFFEIFKNCAKLGNCGGMSLLGLALFKYGGYMGFCGPASFYAGNIAPDRDDLHQAINILQARQFSAPGIENFLDVINAGNLNNAQAAYNEIVAHLGNGDYVVLWIANDILGDAAHTIIPYDYEESYGNKCIYVYDPNFPYDEHPEYYNTRCNRIVFSNPFDWEYHQGFYCSPGSNSATEHNGTHYIGSSSDPGWCIPVPMSVVLHKARHPLALDMVIEGVMTLIVSGPGCAVAQIEDDAGRRYFKSETDGHMLRNEIEIDPAHRLLNVVKWPWFDQQKKGDPPSELYFIRHNPSNPALYITLYGRDYTMIYVQKGDIVEVRATGKKRSRDVISIANVSTSQQALALKTGGKVRQYDIKLQRLFNNSNNWRSVTLKNTQVSTGGFHIQTIADLQTIEISSLESQVSYNLELKQYTEENLIERNLGHHVAASNRSARFTPKDWRDLKDTEIKKQPFQHK
jgi:hypothetical protein